MRNSLANQVGVLETCIMVGGVMSFCGTARFGRVCCCFQRVLHMLQQRRILVMQHVTSS